MVHWSNELKRFINEGDKKYIKMDVNNDDNHKIVLGWKTEQKLVLEPDTANHNSHIKNMGGDLTFFVPSSKSFSFSNRRVREVANPANGTDAANKNYVDSIANKLITVPQNEITFTRVNDVGAQDNNGNFIKWECNNEQVKSFIWENGRQRFKNMTFHFWMGASKLIINNYNVIDDSSRFIILALPPFKDATQKSDFIAKRNLTQVRISSAG